MRKHCDYCDTTAIRVKNKYWHCGTCSFNICDGCCKQGKLGTLFTPVSKRQKVNEEQQRDTEADQVLEQ